MKYLMALLAALMIPSCHNDGPAPKHDMCWMEWGGVGRHISCVIQVEITTHNVVMMAETDDGYHITSVFPGGLMGGNTVATKDAYVVVEEPPTVTIDRWCSSSADPPDNHQITVDPEKDVPGMAHVELRAYVKCQDGWWRFIRLVGPAEKTL